MRKALFLICLTLPLQTACAQEAPAAQDNSAATPSPEATDEEIFLAAGFTQTDGRWGKCGDPGTVSYAAGEIVERGDFNADGRPDAMIYEGGTYCFGMTGQGYTLLSQQADGHWKIIDERTGIPEFLATSGADGWPDIEVGGPGFCFPVVRWNGTEYAQHRNEYEGKPCSM